MKNNFFFKKKKKRCDIRSLCTVHPQLPCVTSPLIPWLVRLDALFLSITHHLKAQREFAGKKTSQPFLILLKIGFHISTVLMNINVYEIPQLEWRRCSCWKQAKFLKRQSCCSTCAMLKGKSGTVRQTGATVTILLRLLLAATTPPPPHPSHPCLLFGVCPDCCSCQHFLQRCISRPC